MPTLKTPTFEEISRGLPRFDEVTAGLADFEAVCEGMEFPADAPTFDAQADPEVNTVIRLGNDLTHARTPTERKMVDHRKANPSAVTILNDLPGVGGSLHAVLCGRFALFEMIPALIERTGQPIAELTLTTLSFSKQNAADLLGLIDNGKVQHVGLLISYFFKSQNRGLYDLLVPALKLKGFPVLAMRVHAKLVLARMSDGTKYVIESSANLRSCDNVETFVMTRCDQLYQFHHDWIYGQLLTGKELGTD